jgi:hypothetical protein
MVVGIGIDDDVLGPGPRGKTRRGVGRELDLGIVRAGA